MTPQKSSSSTVSLHSFSSARRLLSLFASLLCGSSSQSNNDRNVPSTRLWGSPTFCLCHGRGKKNHPFYCSLSSSRLSIVLCTMCWVCFFYPSTKLSDSRFTRSVLILPLNLIQQKINISFGVPFTQYFTWIVAVWTWFFSPTSGKVIRN